MKNTMHAQAVMLLSGGSRARGFLFPALITDFQKILEGKKNLVAISASRNAVKTDAAFYGTKESLSVKDQFASTGIEDFFLLDSRVSPQKAQEKIRHADVIYLMGGDPLFLLEFLKNEGYDALLQDFTGVFIGLSAGAMALAKHAFYSADEEIPHSFFYPALGICDLSCDPHFEADEKRIENTKVMAQTHDIIGLENDACVMLHADGTLQTFGRVHFFYASEKEKH